jgi:hypothetical protein
MTSADRRGAYLSAVDQATAMLARPEVAATWDAPSALAEFSVGGLAGHLFRSLLTVEQYLDRPEPRGDGAGSAAAYYHALPMSPDPATAPNRSVRAGGDEAAARGPAAVAAEAAAARARLADRLPRESLERRVLVTNGIVLTLGEYLATRIVELLVHTDDLAVSIGAPTPEPSPEAAGAAIDTLVGLARLRHGDVAVLRALARRERDAAGVLRVL